MDLSVGQSLSAIFADTAKHKEIREIIQHHSTNKLDIRELALEGLKLDSAKTILDLGCGFGCFTQSLKDKIPLNASILGIDRFTQNKSSFLDICKSVGRKGEFNALGVETVKSLPSSSFDLILCSYALYFFGELIPEISRILKSSGYFIIITHSDQHAKECVNLVRETFEYSGFTPPEYLPYENLIARFNNKNGYDLLSPHFANVKQKEYKSFLLFNKSDFNDLKSYFEFKKPYYLPGKQEIGMLVAKNMLSKLKAMLDSGIPFKINKNDTIFICRNPLVN